VAYASRPSKSIGLRKDKRNKRNKRNKRKPMLLPLE
jgi:hypothetical protein